jgi:hypothetical protein
MDPPVSAAVVEVTTKLLTPPHWLVVPRGLVAVVSGGNVSEKATPVSGVVLRSRMVKVTVVVPPGATASAAKTFFIFMPVNPGTFTVLLHPVGAEPFVGADTIQVFG